MWHGLCGKSLSTLLCDLMKGLVTRSLHVPNSQGTSQGDPRRPAGDEWQVLFPRRFAPEWASVGELSWVLEGELLRLLLLLLLLLGRQEVGPAWRRSTEQAGMTWALLSDPDAFRSSKSASTGPARPEPRPPVSPAPRRLCPGPKYA